MQPMSKEQNEANYILGMVSRRGFINIVFNTLL